MPARKRRYSHQFPDEEVKRGHPVTHDSNRARTRVATSVKTCSIAVAGEEGVVQRDNRRLLRHHPQQHMFATTLAGLQAITACSARFCEARASLPEVPTADGDFASRRDGSSCVEAARSREHRLFWSVVRSTTSFPSTLPPSDKARRCSLGTASLRAFVMLASESSAPAPLASFHCAESRSLEVPRMLFSSSLAALAAVSAVHASPVVKRQGPGTGLPTNATRPDTSSGNVTYTPVSSTEQVGSSYLNATVESVPLGVNNTGNWTVPYTNGSEPYPGAHIFIGELSILDKSKARERRLTSARPQATRSRTAPTTRLRGPASLQVASSSTNRPTRSRATSVSRNRSRCRPYLGVADLMCAGDSCPSQLPLGAFPGIF